MPVLTIHVCDPTPYSSFEEQWGAQLGEAQARQADEDWEADQLETERQQFCELLGDPDFEPDLADEPNLERWTETCEPEIVE
jgi:hypothetical protein